MIMKRLIFTIWILLLIITTNIYSVAFSQNLWYQQTMQGNQLRSVCFVNSNIGWAVGQLGTVLNTTNSGSNWSNQISGTSYALSSVNFISDTTGWIVGEQGTILKTTNKGSNWTRQTSGTSYLLLSVHFIDYNTGWTVGNDGTILKTTNGGVNWSLQTSGLLYTSLFSVYFIDSNIGWIVGGDAILKTTNGGSNWIHQIDGLNYSKESIYFVDINTGWAVGGPGTIIKTTNGGNNWTSQQSGSGSYLESICFINSNTGWTVGSGGTILNTTNGGSNWTNQTSGVGGSLFSVYFINDFIGWTVGSDGTILSTLSPDSNYVGITSIIEPSLDSIYSVDCINNKIINPKITLGNFGKYNQNNFFDVHFEIKQGENILYSSTKQDTISSGQTHTLNFDPYTIAFDFSTYNVNLKTYSVKSWTSLQSDTNHSNDTLNSTFTVNNPNYGYSDISGYYFLNSSTGASCIPDQPVFNWEDTTGSVNLITNGETVVPYTDYNSFYFSGCFRLPDVLPDGNKFKFFGTCYDTIVIATNGIIGLGGSTTGMNIPFPVSLPSASAPSPAIFPFWYWCNFLDPEITGRNLKYKVTADKFIVTYDRVPIYNTIINSQDYLSYQVILEIGSGCGIDNGKITVQFDDSKSGSYFLNNYYSGNLNAMTVGIQNSTGTVGLQYRRSNSTHQLSVPGPLFGSPLAVRFGEINSVLPIELNSFSSSQFENTVTLNWQTNTETNNSGFDIERSIIKDQWTKAGFIQGIGNSNDPIDYCFKDKNLSPGKYKYRLKQIDFNGSFEYFDLSGEVVIGVPEKYELSQNYPNPFNPATVIRYSLTENSFTSLKIYDVTGREITKLVNEKQEAGRYEVIFNGSNFASGVYFYELRSGEFVARKRMVLLK